MFIHKMTIFMLAKEYLIRDVKSQMNSLPKKIITNEYVIIKNKIRDHIFYKKEK
jgi:hypothetical protein